MDEITANISFDKFADMPEFYGSGEAGYRLVMVKKREDFLELFEGASHVSRYVKKRARTDSKPQSAEADCTYRWESR